MFWLFKPYFSGLLPAFPHDWDFWTPFLLSHITPSAVSLKPQHALTLALIHEQAFTNSWSVLDFETYLTDGLIQADGLCFPLHTEPFGFVLSRLVVDEAEILTFALARCFRGYGYSTRLLSFHLKNLQKRGIRQVHLDVDDTNLPALALYRNFGFKKTGFRPHYYARPDRLHNALVMSLDLRDF